MPDQLQIQIRPRTQFRAYLERTQRWACLVVHRRAGKTYACVQDLLRRALTDRRKGPPRRYAYLAPTREQAKDIAWNYVREFFGRVPATDFNQQELKATLKDGTTLRLYSGEAYERMRGLYLDGIVIDESADIDALAWPAVIRPTLTDYQGWATFIGTPKGRNQFYRIHTAALADPDWYTLTLRASESGLIPPAELEAIRRTTVPPELFLQEYECDFSIGRPGAIYSREIERARAAGRIAETIEWFRERPVYTAWDVGSPVNTKVWIFQILGDRINFLEALSGDLDCTTPADWVARLRVRAHPYAGHFLPHDALVENGGQWETGLRTAGMDNLVGVPRQRNVWDGVATAQAAFCRCWFRVPSCADGLDALDNYHAKQEHDGISIRDFPVHDWASHYADAFSLAHQAISAGLCIDRTAVPRYHHHRARRAIT